MRTRGDTSTVSKSWLSGGEGSLIGQDAVDGSEVRQPTHLTAPERAGDWDYSPGGGRVLYVSDVGATNTAWGAGLTRICGLAGGPAAQS